MVRLLKLFGVLELNMSVRIPLTLTAGSNFREFSVSEMTQMVSEAIRRYSLSPSVTLGVGDGNLGNNAETRLRAGAAINNASTYPNEASTPEPAVITTNFNKVVQNYNSLTTPIDTDNIRFPLYQSGGNLYSMTLEDMYDTFIDPAIDLLVAENLSESQGGTYRTHNGTSGISGATLISSTPIYTDTRANVSAYQAGGIPEVLDQPVVINNYYLWRINGASDAGVIPNPIYINSSGEIRRSTETEISDILSELVRYYATQDGSKIEYFIGTNPVGSRDNGMIDTRLNGPGNYQTRFTGGLYYAQEFPNGSPYTVATRYLRCIRS
jgi:hypothetical protein